MMQKRTVLIGWLGLCAVAACSSDRASAPPGMTLTDKQVSLDVAVSAGIAATEELADQSDYVADAGVSPTLLTAATLGDHRAPAPAPSADGATPTSAPSATTKPTCSFSSTTGRWSCTAFVNSRGLTVIRSYAFYDASGAPMQKYDSLGTARINYQADVSGPVGNGVTFYGTTHQKSNQTASGLLGRESTRVWDGVTVSADTTSHKDSVSTRRYAGVRVDSMQAVTWTQPRRKGDVPLSGKTVLVANYTVTSVGRQTETRSVSRRSVITYTGTTAATLQVGTVTCTLHLDTRKVDGCRS